MDACDEAKSRNIWELPHDVLGNLWQYLFPKFPGGNDPEENITKKIIADYLNSFSFRLANKESNGVFAAVWPSHAKSMHAALQSECERRQKLGDKLAWGAGHYYETHLFDGEIKFYIGPLTFPSLEECTAFKDELESRQASLDAECTAIKKLMERIPDGSGKYVDHAK